MAEEVYNYDERAIALVDKYTENFAKYVELSDKIESAKAVLDGLISDHSELVAQLEQLRSSEQKMYDEMRENGVDVEKFKLDIVEKLKNRKK